MLHATHSLSSVTLDCNQTMSLGPAKPQDEDSNESFKSNATLELEYSFVPCPKKTVFVSLKSMLIKRTNIRDESQKGPCGVMNSIVEDRLVPAVCDSSTSHPFSGADRFVDVDSSVVVVVSSDGITEDSKFIPKESEHNHVDSIFNPEESNSNPEISHFKSEELNMNPEDTSNLNPQDFFDYEYPQSETVTIKEETVEPTELNVKEENVEPTEFNVKEENIEPAELTVKQEKVDPTESNCGTKNSILSNEIEHGAEPCTVVMTENVLCDIQANYTISEMESTSDVKLDSHDSAPQSKRIDESVSKDKVKMSRSKRSRSRKCSYTKSKSRRSCSKSRKRSKSRSKSKNNTRRKSRSVSRNRYRSRRSRSKGKHPKSRNRRRSRSRSRSRPRRKPRSHSISFKKSRSRSRRKSPPHSKRKSRSRSRKKSRSRSRRKSRSHSKRKSRERSNSRSRRKSRSKSPHKSFKSSPKVENCTLPTFNLNDIASMIKIEDVNLPGTSAPIIKEEIENPAESVAIKCETMAPPEEQKSILSCDPPPKPANITLRLMKMASEESEAVPCSSKCEQKPPPTDTSDPIKSRDKSRSRSRKRSDRKSRSKSRGRTDSGGKRDGLQGFYFSRYEVMKQRILNTPIKDFQNITKMSGMSTDGFFNCEGTNIGIPGANKDNESDEFVLPPLNLRVTYIFIFTAISLICFKLLVFLTAYFPL